MYKLAIFKMFVLFPIMHLILLWGLFTSGESFIILTLGILLYFPIHFLGGGVGYHRMFSHRAFEPKPWFPLTSAIVGTVSFNSDPLTYSLIHRIHHKHADTDLDPHTPIKGLFNSYIGWIATYSPRERDKLIVLDLVKKWPWLIEFRKFEIIIIILFHFLLYTINPVLFYTVLLACLLSIHCGLSVNAFAHNPNKESTNRAVNNVFLSKIVNPIFMHHSHHENPNKFDYSEGSVVDYSKYFIKIVTKN